LTVNRHAVQRNVRRGTLMQSLAENVRCESLLADEHAPKNSRATGRRVLLRHGREHEEITFSGNALLQLPGDGGGQLLAYAKRHRGGKGFPWMGGYQTQHRSTPMPSQFRSFCCHRFAARLVCSQVSLRPTRKGSQGWVSLFSPMRSKLPSDQGRLVIFQMFPGRRYFKRPRPFVPKLLGPAAHRKR
jgi:hypothetical protein